jgi:hypothetical protein
MYRLRGRILEMDRKMPCMWRMEYIQGRNYTQGSTGQACYGGIGEAEYKTLAA